MSVCHYLFQCLGLGELINWSELCSLHTFSTVFPQGKASQLRSFTCLTAADGSFHLLNILCISASWCIMLPVLTDKSVWGMSTTTKVSATEGYGKHSEAWEPSTLLLE